MISASLPRPLLTATSAAPVLKTDIRPNVEWWEVNGQRFDSTADLVKSGSLPASGADATYHFRDKAQFTEADTRQAVVDGAISGAGIGALVLGGGALALNVVAGIFTVFTGGLFGMPAFVGVLAPALVGAAAGAVIGSASAPKMAREAFEQGTVISGKLVPGAAGPTFYVGGQIDSSIDIGSFAKAQPAPAAPPVPDVPKWMDALKGAGLGAATPLSLWIPLVGMIAPTAVCAAAGRAIHKGGGSLGAAVGVGVTAGVIAAANSPLGLTAFPIAAGVGAVTGAVLGPVVFPRIRQAEAEDALTQGQWWRAYAEQV